MRLRAGERRALRRIEADLCRSDPRLRSMFCMFARLTPGPGGAPGPSGAPAADTPARSAPSAAADPSPSAAADPGTGGYAAAGWRRSLPRLLARPAMRLVLFISVVVLMVAFAILYGGGHPGAAQCRPVAQPQPGAGPSWRYPTGHRFVAPPAPDSYGTSCAPDGGWPDAPPLTQP